MWAEERKRKNAGRTSSISKSWILRSDSSKKKSLRIIRKAWKGEKVIKAKTCFRTKETDRG